MKNELSQQQLCYVAIYMEVLKSYCKDPRMSPPDIDGADRVARAAIENFKETMKQT